MSTRAQALEDPSFDRARLQADVLAGLSSRPRRLPSKYFYDAQGSALFERITEQPEYYLTAAEHTVLDSAADQVAAIVGHHAHVIEFGSGAGHKTRTLLAALDTPVAYTPVEISSTALLDSMQRLAAEFPGIEMLPLRADFTSVVTLPAPEASPAVRLVFFPGSTLGNFEDREAVALLAGIRVLIRRNGFALVGIDLDKEPAVIEAAYNDAAGVTAAFTLNLLRRLNRELDADFDLSGFHHRALYQSERYRIETSLVSHRVQRVTVAGQPFDFAEGEAMQVEYSHKYTDAGFSRLAAGAGFRLRAAWDAPRRSFGLRLLQPA